MKEREYLRLKRQIDAEYQEKMRALELVWRMSGKPAPRPEWLPRTAVQQMVQAFLNQWRDNEFSLDEVFKYVRQESPNILVNRSSLSKALRRFVQDGELEITFQGKGNKPSRYRRVSGAPKAA